MFIAPKERATAMEAPSVAGAPQLRQLTDTTISRYGATPPIGHSVERAIAKYAHHEQNLN